LRSNYTKRSSPDRLDSGRTSKDLKSVVALAYRNWSDDDGFRLAAALAYYSLLSLAPLVLIAAVIAGFVLSQQHVQFLLATRLYEVIGAPASSLVQEIVEGLPERSAGLVSGIVGILLLFVGASAVFSEMQDALNKIWREEKGNGSAAQIILDRAYSFVLVLVAVMLLLGGVVLTTLLLVPAEAANASSSASTHALHSGGFFLSACVTVLLFALIFKLVPRKHVAWSEAWMSAAVSGVMFEAGKVLIALYLGAGRFRSLYGAAGSVVLFVAWVYYSAIVLYIGAEFAHAYSTSGRRESIPWDIISAPRKTTVSGEPGSP